MTTLRRAMLPIAASMLLAACSTAASPTPDPTAPPVTPDPTESAAAATSHPSASATADGSVDPWQANAVEHRTHNGLEFEYDCPAGGEPDTIWGTDTYTDDSSVCTAGVHVGVITLDEGGTVTIEIRPGEDQYVGSERNGVESSAYPAWGGSFVVIDD